MIRMKISTEAFADIFTANALTPHKCVEGLPRNIDLVSIELDTVTNTVICLFEDGKLEIVDAKIVLQSVLEVA